MIDLDLDPAVIERARANADRAGNGDQPQPSFLVGDVAALAFPDGSFDRVVSRLLSMHHWADPTAGLVEIGRVLRSGAGRWSGISAPVSGPIRSDHVTGTCPIRLSRPIDAACLADRNAFGHQAAVSATASVTP